MGDLNLWNADDISERFYSSKTRQFHATHLSTGDRLWSCFPFLRPMATITADTLGWSATTSLAAAPRAARCFGCFYTSILIPLRGHTASPRELLVLHSGYSL